jgi:hypothetical protein
MIHGLAAANGPCLIVRVVISFAFYAVKNMHHLFHLAITKKYEDLKTVLPLRSENHLMDIEYNQRIGLSIL